MRSPITLFRRRYTNLIGDGAFLPPKPSYKVTVVGAGNSAHVIAGYAGSMHNVEVSMLNTVAHENEKLKNNMHKNMTVKHRNGQDDIIGISLVPSLCPNILIVDFVSFVRKNKHSE